MQMKTPVNISPLHFTPLKNFNPSFFAMKIMDHQPHALVENHLILTQFSHQKLQWFLDTVWKSKK